MLKMQSQISEFLEHLEAFNLPIFANEVAEDEEAALKKGKKGFNFFVYETGEITKLENSKTVSQDIVLYHYSENQSNIDEKTIEIIKKLAPVTTLFFQNTTKQRLRKKDTDHYVDLVIFYYTRSIPLGCVLS